MERLQAICCLDDVITYYKDMETEAPTMVKSRVRDVITFYEVLKQFRAGEQPTQKVNRKHLDKQVRKLTKEINDAVKGKMDINFPNYANFWSKFAPIDILLELVLLRDLQSYLDNGKSFESVMVDKFCEQERLRLQG